MAQGDPSLSPNLDLPIFPRYPGISKAVANHLARRAVERQLQAQGIRLTTFPYAKVVAQARVYLAVHPELFNQAIERVRASPWHSMMAEREEREPERQRRKLARAGIVENPLAQTCLSNR
jgi:hypothetical protein